MNHYPLLYPFARYRDEDDEYRRRVQPAIDAETEAERIAKYAAERKLERPT